MDWTQPLVVSDSTLFAGVNGERWLGSFSSHEAAIEALTLRRECREVLTADETYCCTESDLDLLAAIDADEE